MNLFLYPEVPRVNVLRSLSCSQNDPFENSPSNYDFVFQSSLEFPDLGTSFHYCVKLCFSNAQCCQALKRRSRFHSVVTDLSHQSRRALSRDWVASKVAVHEDCGLVNMFLSSKSQRCFGLSHQISRCTFQRDKVEFARLTHSLGQMFRCFSKIQSVLGQV